MQNNPKDLDPFCKTDLDLYGCFASETELHKTGFFFTYLR